MIFLDNQQRRFGVKFSEIDSQLTLRVNFVNNPRIFPFGTIVFWENT